MDNDPPLPKALSDLGLTLQDGVLKGDYLKADIRMEAKGFTVIVNGVEHKVPNAKRFVIGTLKGTLMM